MLVGNGPATRTGVAAVYHPLSTGRVVYKIAVMVTRQERHCEFSVRRVLGANKEPKAESGNRESPSLRAVATPMADEPGEDKGD